MKKLLAISTLALATLTNTAYANNELKIKTVKSIYAHNIKHNEYTVPTKYATPSFAKAINRIKKVNQHHIDNGNGIACYESNAFILHPDTWEITEPFKKQFMVNKQGQVVAKLSYKNQYSQGTETHHFVLQCTKTECKVDDLITVLDNGGTFSHKSALQEYCPK